MGLKFKRDDSLDKRFEEFAFFPEDKDEKAEKHAQDIERFLNPKEKPKEEPKK